MGAPPAVGPARFSTAGLPGADRVGRWEAWNAGALVGLRATPAPRSSFTASQVSRQLPGARLARVRASAHTVRRDAGAVAAAPTGAVAVYLPLGPVGRFATDAGDLTLGPATVLVCDADRPFTREFPTGVDEVVLTVARPAGVALDRPVAFDLATGGPAVAPAVALARALTAGDGAAWRLGPLTHALLAGTDPPAALDLARSYVTFHLADPSLSAATIAAAVGVSDRQLSRTFAAVGSSVPGEVLEQRLQRARVLLERTPGRSPADAARAVGIASASHFTKRFTARFGATPGRWATG